MYHKTQKGFSLLEVMIAIVIISILAAVGYPTYASHMAKASRSEAIGAIMTIAQRQHQYFNDAREYASTLGSSGLNMIIAKGDSFVLSGNESFVCTGADVTSCSSPTHTITLSNVDNDATPPTFTIAGVANTVGRNKDDDDLEINEKNEKTGPWKQ